MVTIIKYINENITVFSYENGIFTPLKYKGENFQKFQADNFWKWFDSKICYDNEAISFIILTDKKEFEIPNYFKLNNSFKLDRNLREYIDKYLGNYFLLTKPTINITLETSKSDKNSSQKPSQKIKKGSISEYFLNKTKKYKKS